MNNAPGCEPIKSTGFPKEREPHPPTNVRTIQIPPLRTRIRLLVSDVSPHLIVVPDKAEMKIPTLRQKENPQIQPGTKLKIFSERTQPDARMQMRPSKYGFKTGDGDLHRRRLLCCQRTKCPVKFRPGINHVFQGLSLPALRSPLIAAKSRLADFSTSSGVTRYSSNGEAGPTKKLQTASCTAAEASLKRPVFTCVSTRRINGSESVMCWLLTNSRWHNGRKNQTRKPWFLFRGNGPPLPAPLLPRPRRPRSRSDSPAASSRGKSPSPAGSFSRRPRGACRRSR